MSHQADQCLASHVIRASPSVLQRKYLLVMIFEFRRVSTIAEDGIRVDEVAVHPDKDLTNSTSLDPDAVR